MQPFMHTIVRAHSLQILFSSLAKSPKMELNITELCVAHRYKSVVPVALGKELPHEQNYHSQRISFRTEPA